jgi:hypothetical protein
LSKKGGDVTALQRRLTKGKVAWQPVSPSLKKQGSRLLFLSHGLETAFALGWRVLSGTLNILVKLGHFGERKLPF